MKKSTQKLPLLIALAATIITVLCITIVSLTVYRHHLDDTRLRLTSLAKLQAQHMMSLDNHISSFEHNPSIDNLESNAIIEMLRLHGDKASSIEFVAIEDIGTGFKIRVYNSTGKLGKIEILSESELSVPMRRALKGESGICEDMNSEGESVLAAYESVHPPDLGIVIVEDLSTIRKPFIQAGFIITVLLLLVMGSSYTILKSFFASLLQKTCAESQRLTEEMEARKAAEASLVRSEQRFRLAAKAATDLIYEWDMATDKLSWFGDIDKALGGKPGEFSHTLQSWLDIIHPDDKARMMEHVRQQRQYGASVDVEYRIKTRGGEVRTWKDVGRTIFGKDNKPARLIGTCRDMTEKRRYEEVLEHQASLFNNAFDAIITLDLNDKITAWNDGAERIYGYCEQEALGQSVHKLLKTTFDFESHRQIGNSIREKGFWQGQVTQYSRDNHALVIHVTVNNLYDSEGKIIGSVGSHRNITERVKADKALLEEKRKAQEYLDVAGTILVALDSQGRISMINRKGCEILGWEKSQLIGKDWFAFCLPENARIEVSSIFCRLMKGEVNPVEYIENMVLTKDGQERIIAWYNKLLFADDGSIAGTLSSGEDVTDRKKAEQDIHTQTVHLLNALRIAKLGPWQYDVANDTFTFNDEFYAIFKTTVEAVGGYEMSSMRYAGLFVHPEDAPLVGAEVQKALETKDPEYARQLEHRIVYADGNIGYIAVRFQVEMNGEGQVVRTFGINQDITDQVVQQQELKKSESKLRQIFDNSGEGILIADLDEHIVMANPAAHKIFGAAEGELVGQDVREFVIPEHHSLVGKNTELRLKGEINSYELTIQRPDSEHRYVIVTGSPWRDHDDRVIGSCGIIRDITARERALAETRAARKMLQDVIDAIPGTVFWKDRDSVFKGCNQLFAELAGLESPADIVGQTDYDLPWTKEESDLYRECDQRIMNNNKAEKHIIETQRTAEGQDLWIDTSKIPLHDDSGNVIGILGLYQDITEEVKSRQERQKLEDQLRQSQKLETIGTLAGGIAHDFNNILVPILVTSQMLLDETEKDTQIFEDVEQINIAAKRARELVKHILTFSRQTDGERINIDLTQIVKEVVKLLQSSLPSSITLNYNIETDCGRAIADPTQIHQVLMNLCTNAYQAIGEQEGRIDVRLGSMSLSNEEAREYSMQSAGEYIMLSVGDTGCGIKPDTLQHIFDPFFTTKDVGKGTGLGLSVAHGIAKNHGGTILVKSEPGKGSVFTLYLPKAETVSAVVTEEEIRSKGGSERVLVADDDPSVAQMAKRILEGYGYQVTIRTSSVECVEAFRANPDQYDIVLTDQIMPHMTGDQMIKLIHEIRSDIPSVVMTGFSATVTEENYHRFGFDAFIMKPMVPNQLNVALRNALDRSIAKTE